MPTPQKQVTCPVCLEVWPDNPEPEELAMMKKGDPTACGCGAGLIFDEDGGASVHLVTPEEIKLLTESQVRDLATSQAIAFAEMDLGPERYPRVRRPPEV